MSGLKRAMGSLGKGLKHEKKQSSNKLLEILTVTDPENEILESPGLTVGSYSKKVKAHVEEMKKAASVYGVPSVSARQFGLEYNIFLIARKLTENVWNNYGDIRPSSYEIFINPRIEEVSKLMEIGWEECPSVPNLRAKVRRFESVRVSFLNEDFDEVERELRGFNARVFQHELDHLLGLTILNWKVSGGDIEVIDEELNRMEEKEIEEEMRKEKERERVKDSINTLKKEVRQETRPRSVDELNTNDHDVENTTYFDLQVAKEERDKLWEKKKNLDKELKEILKENISKGSIRRKK